MTIHLFLVTFVLGIVRLAFLALTLGGLTLFITKESGGLARRLRGRFRTILPSWLRPIGYSLPLTYWLELTRRALLGSNTSALPTSEAYSDAQLMTNLVALSAVYGISAPVFFRSGENRARQPERINADTYA